MKGPDRAGHSTGREEGLLGGGVAAAAVFSLPRASRHHSCPLLPLSSSTPLRARANAASGSALLVGARILNALAAFSAAPASLVSVAKARIFLRVGGNSLSWPCGGLWIS